MRTRLLVLALLAAVALPAAARTSVDIAVPLSVGGAGVWVDGHWGSHHGSRVWVDGYWGPAPTYYYPQPRTYYAPPAPVYYDPYPPPVIYYDYDRYDHHGHRDGGWHEHEHHHDGYRR